MTMNVANNVVTQVSGATVIGSALSSKTAEYVASSAPTPEVMERATSVMVSSDQLALASFLVMLGSALWNIYSGRRRDKLIDETKREELVIRRAELELEKRKVTLLEKEKADD